MKKSMIVYGSCAGVQKKAMEYLSQTILDYTCEFPACVGVEDAGQTGEFRCFYVGTKQNNAYICAHSDAVLTHPEEYAILVENDTVMIEGSDDAGVLYGCVDFYSKYLMECEITHNSDRYFVNPFEKPLPDARIISHPAVSNRGLWTWGHVIYDYKGYIDNMVRLKMNTVVVWNDFIPINAAEMVEYAHLCNVQVIWGFSWLWDTNCLESGLADLDRESENIAALYERDYAGLNGDGIYFQSFTELHQEYIGDILIAEAVTNFVNNTASKILEKHPGLELQFGLHATSVKEKLEYIAKTDPRIRIVWEDCGAFPFSYLPEDVENFEQTKDFASRISNLRGKDDCTGMVLKGLTKLDWGAFEHQKGPFFMGSSSKQMQHNRMDRKKKIWHVVQAGWLVNGGKVQEMVKLLRDCTGGNLHLTALVEDGMFEKKLYYPVALLGEILWDCDTDYEKLSYQVAARSDVEFA